MDNYSYVQTSSGEDIFGLITLLCCCIITLPFILFWIWMLIDASKREYPAGRENEKLIWLLIILLTSPFNTMVGIGAIIYYFSVKRKADDAKKMPQSVTIPTVTEVVESKPVEETKIPEKTAKQDETNPEQL